MPRIARVKSESGIYHVMLRGINKQPILSDDIDKLDFLNCVKKVKSVCKFEIYAYCVMSNHIHLLIKENDEFRIDNIIKRIAVSFAYRYNLNHGRTGHLFQDRFRSEPVDSERYFLTVLRYIHQNPVKANLCTKLDEYPWHSFGAYNGVEDNITDTYYALDIVSHSELIDFMSEINEERCLDDEPARIKGNKEIKKIYEQITGGLTEQEFNDLPQTAQRHVIEKCKQAGISDVKISELTGKTRYFISKIH